MENGSASMKDIAPIISDVVNNGGKFRLTVTGSSMYPIFIENRDSVMLKKAVKLKKLDIILYKRDNGNYVLHRIVKIKKNILYLCGDNQTVIEYPIRKDQVIAVVDGFFRKDKYFKINNFKYFVYSFIWGNLIPVRKIMYKSYIKIRKLIEKK